MLRGLQPGFGRNVNISVSPIKSLSVLVLTGKEQRNMKRLLQDTTWNGAFLSGREEHE